jgi:hypothetical protein
MARNKHSPPSRRKYDLSHPTVSVRVSKELYRELNLIRRTAGKSLGDILREAVGKQFPSTKNAYLEGFNDAKLRYAIDYPCSDCGGKLTIESEKEKNAVVAYMREQGWHHGSCPGTKH